MASACTLPATSVKPWSVGSRGAPEKARERAMNDASATFLFHTVGERITEVGLGGIPDAYEQPRSTLDLSLEHPVFAGARLRIEAENLLDSETEILQGGVTRLHYRTGRGLSIGLSVQP